MITTAHAFILQNSITHNLLLAGVEILLKPLYMYKDIYIYIKVSSENVYIYSNFCVYTYINVFDTYLAFRCDAMFNVKIQNCL